MTWIADLYSYWLFRAAVASLGLSLITCPQWLPGATKFIRRKDIEKGNEVVADFDRMFAAAHQMIKGNTSEGDAEAVETWQALFRQYGGWVGIQPGQDARSPEQVLQRVSWLAETFRHHGYKEGARRAEAPE